MLTPEQEERIAQLDATICRCWAQRGEEGIKIGRALNEQKHIFGHGKWQRHFKETLAPIGISLRTAERWMKRARKKDAVERNDNMSILETATDRGAQEIKDATARAEAEASTATHNKPSQKRRLHNLPLHVTDVERDASDALLKSTEWPHAEKEIIHLLKHLCVKHGIVDKEFRRLL
jgi:hypothetical protein